MMRKVECTAVRELRPTPDAAKTQFDRVRDQEQVAQLLHAGCTHMRKAFDIEDINLEELIAIDRASGSQWRTSFTLRMTRTAQSHSQTASKSAGRSPSREGAYFGRLSSARRLTVTWPVAD